MPTVVYTVQASHDDTDYYDYAAECNNEDAFISLYKASNPARNDYGGVRFTGVAMTPSHIIVSAHLRLRSQGNTTGDTVNIFGHDADATPDYTAPNCNPADRASTTATVSWATGNLVAGTWYETNDISAIVQELANRPGLGGIMGFKLSPAAIMDIGFYSFDGGSPPELHVTYKPIYQGGGIL